MFEYIYQLDVQRRCRREALRTSSFFKKEVLLVKVVINTCEKVLDGTASDLAEFKRTFTVSSGTSVHSEGSEKLGGGSSQTLGTAIPTTSFTDLVCFADIKLLPSTVYEQVVEREDDKEVRKDLTDKLGSVKDIVARAKERILAIKTRKETHQNEQGKKFGDLSAPMVLCCR